jgi:glycerol-3-phosphate acyltransferase PlsY
VLVINVWLGLITLGLALLFLAFTRSFTRSGMVAMALAPVVTWLLGLDTVLVVGVLLLVILLLFAHRENMFAQRLSTQPDSQNPV